MTTRAAWAQLADRLLVAAMRRGSRSHATINFEGPEPPLGQRVSGLEGFARTAMLATFRVLGEPDHLDLVGWYGQGIVAGTDPQHPERWVTMDENRQAVVEAASIVLFLDATREQLWDALPDPQRQRIVDYLARARHQVIPDNNWVWFIIMIETFLASVGAAWDEQLVRRHLARIEEFHVAGGWYRDGVERSFDHYNGWAFNTLPWLWLGMKGAREICGSQRDAFAGRLADYLQDAQYLIGADGAPLAQGRSLIYRCAVAAPFWASAYGGVDTLAPGLIRRAASRIVDYFVRHGAPANDVYNLGWWHEWPGIAQFYSSPGSPYWAAKGFLGLALPPGHPVWTAPEVPLPSETGDFVRALNVPGWLVRASDGVVRVYNHGTDHANPGDMTCEPPLYARLAYSTATFPLAVGESAADPADNVVAILDEQGRPSHRSGVSTLELTTEVARSRWRAHWVEIECPHHLDAHRGKVRLGPWIEVRTTLEGPVETREIVVSYEGDEDVAGPLRVSGWPGGGRVEGMLGFDRAGTSDYPRQSPTGQELVHWVATEGVAAGRYVARISPA